MSTLNDRENAITGSVNWTAITDEAQTIALHTDKNLYGFYLVEYPRSGTLVVRDVSSGAATGATLTVIGSGVPQAGQCRPDTENKTGWVWCNASDVGKSLECDYDGGGYVGHEDNLIDFILSTAGASVTTSAIEGYAYGFALSKNGTDPTNDVDIGAGVCTDLTAAASMIIAATITKRLDAAWAVGSGAGGLDTGAVGNNTYYIWVIKRSDTGVVDVLFSLSSTSPTMPASYDYKRLIGNVSRVSAANLVPSNTAVAQIPKTVVVRDEKAANTNGGGSSAGIQTRALNTRHDPNSWGFCTLASDQFTLTTGKYIIRAIAPTYNVARNRLLLYSVTDAGYVADTEGNTVYSGVTMTMAFLDCEVSITSAKTYELRHYTENAVAGNGLGVAANEGSRVEVYAQVTITKVQ